MSTGNYCHRAVEAIDGQSLPACVRRVLAALCPGRLHRHRRFSYISGGNSTFTSLNLLKFGKNFLNGALADDQLQLLFLEMDTDCDGKVDEIDWQRYFGGKMVQSANVAAGRASALAFVKLLLDSQCYGETLNTRTTVASEKIVAKLDAAFDDAVKDHTTPRSGTPTRFDHRFISRQQFVLFFSRTLAPDCNNEAAGEQTKDNSHRSHTPDDASSSTPLNMEHVFDLFAYLDANSDALIDRDEWIDRLIAVLIEESQRQQQRTRPKISKSLRSSRNTLATWPTACLDFISSISC